MKIETMEELREENQELKRTLVICMNKFLIKELNNALERINSGEYISEEDFFKSSPQ